MSTIANVDICGYPRATQVQRQQGATVEQGGCPSSRRIRSALFVYPKMYQKVVQETKCGIHFLKCSTSIIIAKALRAASRILAVGLLVFVAL